MKDKLRILILVSLVTLSSLFLTELRSASVTVIPNESMIEGIVSEYAILSSRLLGVKPDQVLYRLTVFIESSEDIDSKANLLKDKVGQDVQFYTKKKQSPELFGKRIRARAVYRGDERGGLYWIDQIGIIHQ